ncbi:DNA polymerase I [Peptostreptococcaceae bacterium AGR-M142]
MKNRLILIDGNSLMNRAFYALPPLKNKNGLHTNAIYGFTTMLFKIINDYKPTHMSVAFDLKKPTFRHLEYKEYKGTRSKMSDELREQVKPLKDLIDAFKINRLEMEGFEADDIIGTISKLGEDEEFEVLIVTGDKDALQLASKTTKILFTKKGISELEIYDFDAVLKKYGITPTKLIDLKGLMGDKSDNIPGIPGIGEKTGLKLIKQFDSVENLIENTDQLKGKQKEKVIENASMAVLSKRLATIVRDIPFDIDLEELKFEENYDDKVLELFKEYGFKNLIKKLDMEVVDATKDETNTNVDFTYNIIKEYKLEELIKEIKKNKEIYIKSASKEENIVDKNIIYMYLSTNKKDIYRLNEEDIDKLKEIFEDKGIKKIGSYLKKEYKLLKSYGIQLNGMEFDISIAQYLIDTTSSNFEPSDIALSYFDKTIKSKEDLLGKGKKAITYLEVEKDSLDSYFADILMTVILVKDIMKDKIKKLEMDNLFYDIEMPLCEVLASMEYEGFYVDIFKLKELDMVFSKEIDELTKEIYSYTKEEFNINSPKQLGVILFEELGLKVIKKTKTGYSTSIEVLEKLLNDHPIIKNIIDYRHITKLKSTYVDGLSKIINPKTNRIHSSFNQTITTTGRISSTEPNLQNIPVRMKLGREIRKVFIAKENHKLVDADYSQIELRLLAHISDDEHMKEAFVKEEDIHAMTASKVFNKPLEEVDSYLRGQAKAVNFGIVYGISDFGLSKNLNIPVKLAKEYIDNYLEKYPNIKKYMDDIVDKAKDDGYVTTILNRRRYIPEINSTNFIMKNLGKRLAMNTPIQGGAADIIKIAMVNVYNRLKKENLKSRLILQVHDELIIEAIAEEVEFVKEILKQEMENAIKLNVPLTVDLSEGNSWYEAK